MRIFYASNTSPNVLLNGSRLWRSNLLLPLQDLGHDVIEFDYDLSETFEHLDSHSRADSRFISGNRSKVSAALYDQVARAHETEPIDLLFTYFYDACVLPETIDRIRALGIVAINWYCNGSFQLHLVEQISPHYDWCLVPEKFRLDDYRRLGARPIYCQEAANPNIYRPVDVPMDLDATFVGMVYGERPRAIRRLVDLNIPIRAFGPGWHRCLPQPPVRRLARRIRSAVDRTYESLPEIPASAIGPPLSDDDMIAMFSRSRVNIGLSAVGSSLRAERILQIRLRDFEIPMSGGFYIVEYMQELTEFFEPGREIVCYDTVDDLADKIRYYLEHDEERESIRRRGYERAQREHTWQARFQGVFETIGLSQQRPATTSGDRRRAS